MIMMKCKFNKCVYLLKVIFANLNRVSFYYSIAKIKQSRGGHIFNSNLSAKVAIHNAV